MRGVEASARESAQGGSGIEVGEVSQANANGGERGESPPTAERPASKMTLPYLYLKILPNLRGIT
jgi:hypothetical protein